jgi:hypothetical protein
VDVPGCRSWQLHRLHRARRGGVSGLSSCRTM